MHALSATDILSLWERVESPVEWPLTLLAAVHSGSSREEWASVSVGERDALLLEVRERIFGPEAVGLVGCPACGARLDIQFRTDDVRTPKAARNPPTFIFHSGAFRLQFRLPNTEDLSAVAACGSLPSARQALLGRCLVEALENEERRTLDQLPATLVELLESEMADLDPQADVRLSVTCPECGHAWQELFDIATYLWWELQAYGRRLLREVGVLARAYGWGEAEILALSAARRNAYLDLVTG